MNTAPRALTLGFAGTPEFAVPALDALVASRHTVVGVFTQPDRPAGRGRQLQASPVKRRATEHGIAVHQPTSFREADAADALRALAADALVVVAYGLLLPTAALAIPRLGCINIHGSLLPRWRGAAPIQRALLAGDATTGITIMRMEATLDTGPMLSMRELPIAARDTSGTLHDRLALAGAELIVETLDALAAGNAVERPQPAAGVTYADKIAKAEAAIDWRLDATDLLRRVRAFNPWPVCETTWDGAQFRIWEAESSPTAATVEGSDAWPPNGTVIGASHDGIDVACGRGGLRLLKVQLAGRKPVAAREFVQGRRLVGARFGAS